MPVRKEEKQEQVLQAARDVIFQIGIRKTTLEDVAQKAGMATSSLYYYFKNRQELIRAVATREIESILERIESEVATASTPETKLNAVGRTILEHAQKLSVFPGMRSKELSVAMIGIDSITESFKRRLREIIREILILGQQEGIFHIEDLELTTFVIAAGIRGLTDSILDGEFPKAPTRGMNQMSKILMSGLIKRPDSTSTKDERRGTNQ